MNTGTEPIERREPIQGLTLTLSGTEIRERLDDRIRSHEAQARRWRRELARTPEEQTEEQPLLPDQMCEHEAQRHEWRMEHLEFIRDHLDAGSTYRLGRADLAFAELMPEKPQSIEQEEYEERRLGAEVDR